MAPTRPFTMIHKLPSGPVTIADSPAPKAAEYSVMLPLLGLSFPTFCPKYSVNQRFPSGPFVT